MSVEGYAAARFRASMLREMVLTGVMLAGTCLAHAQAPVVPPIGSRGVQCELFRVAVISHVKMDDPIAPPELAQRVRHEAISQMDAATRRDYEAAVVNRADSDFNSLLGPWAEGLLKRCAARLFPEASASSIQRCNRSLIPAPAVAAYRKSDRGLQDAMLVGSLRNLSAEPIGTQEFVDYFYQFPVSAYRAPFAVSRITGGWIEKCLGTY